MESGVIQKTIVALVLIVLAFMAGSMVAESRSESLLFIGGAAAVAFVIMMGRRCWWLIFLAPPLLNLVPLGLVQRMPVGFAVGCVVMLYWTALTAIGKARMRWRSLAWMDLVVLLVLLLFIYSYLCHPVVMGYFASFDDREVGGQEYLWCFFACLYYASLSLIPCSKDELDRVLKWSLWLVVMMTVVSTMRNVSQTSVDAMAEGMATSRFSMFSGIGQVMVLLVLCRYRMLQVVFSPLLMAALILGAAMVILCGFRESFVSLVCMILFIAFIRRELVTVSILAAGMYALLLLLSSAGIVKEMPYGIQRSLSIVPGVEVERHIESGASHSSEWRVVMWRWALDPRTGYIKDYTWGDGFAVDRFTDARSVRTMYRGESSDPQFQKRFARTGTWHNGPITVIHRLGIVGLCVFSLFMLGALGMIARVCSAYRGRPEQFYYLYLLVPMAGGVFSFYLSAGTIPSVFSLMSYVALGKVVYCQAREGGLLQPLFSRRSYIPMIQRQIGEGQS